MLKGGTPATLAVPAAALLIRLARLDECSCDAAAEPEALRWAENMSTLTPVTFEEGYSTIAGCVRHMLVSWLTLLSCRHRA